ncbi:MAG: hypothetical protein ACI4U0_02645 [Candidatus Aphodocola sp.]
MFLFSKNKKIKVVGEIIGFEIENGKHYPVFKFESNDGKIYKLRNIPKSKDLQETSLEDVYTDEGVIEFLNKAFPITNIPIKYLEEDPTDFLPRWI